MRENGGHGQENLMWHGWVESRIGMSAQAVSPEAKIAFASRLCDLKP